MNEQNFKKGDYVVLLASCNGTDHWAPDIPINHCYKLRMDFSIGGFYMEKDMKLSTGNGWSSYNPKQYGNDKIQVRAATQQEIEEYNKYDKPFNVNNLKAVEQEIIFSIF